MISKGRLLSLSMLIALGMLWGSGYVIAKYCVTHGVPALGYSFWQSLGPAIALTIISLWQQHKVPIKKKYLAYYGVCGLLGIAFPNSLMYFSARYVPAGILAVLVNTVPIITFPLALAAKQDKFSWLKITAVLIGVAGILWIVTPHELATDNLHWGWTLAVLLTPLSFAICAVFISACRPVPSHAIGLSAGMLIFSSIILLPIVISQHAFYALTWPFDLTQWLILLEILLSSTGYVLFFALIRRAGPTFYSLVSGVVALTGLFWGRIIFGESLSITNIAAIVLVITAIIMITYER